MNLIHRCVAVLALTLALTTTSPVYAGTITIAQDDNAAQGNFQTPGTTATVGYTIAVSDDGIDFNVFLSTTDPKALPFANLYIDTIASTPNTGSNLGFEFGQSSMDAFYPNTGVKYVIDGMGVGSTFSVDTTGTTALIVIPNNFFLNNPASMPFASTPAGTLVSLHLSQSFGYSVVGGGANYAAPIELGDAIVDAPSVAPEPNSLVLFGIGGLGLLIGLYKKSK